MPKLPNSARAWPSDSFAQTLKGELENLERGALPLDKAALQGGHVDDSRITATILRVADGGNEVRADVGIFFDEIIAGCSCGDDAQSQSAYCEIQVRIDKATAEAAFALIPG